MKPRLTEYGEAEVRQWYKIKPILERKSNPTHYFVLVAGGHPETLNGRGEKVRLSVKEAHFGEASTPFDDHSKQMAW